MHQLKVRVVLGQMEVGDVLLVEPHIPADGDVLLGLGFLQSAIVVGLKLDQGTEHVLVLVAALVPRIQKNIVVDKMGDRKYFLFIG